MSPKKRIVSHDLDLEPVRKLLFRSAAVADNIGLVDHTSSGVRHFRPSISKDIDAAEGIPATEDIPATKDIPAAKNISATEDIPPVEDIPATEDVTAIEHIPASEELHATADIPGALNTPVPLGSLQSSSTDEERPISPSANKLSLASSRHIVFDSFSLQRPDGSVRFPNDTNEVQSDQSHLS